MRLADCRLCKHFIPLRKIHTTLREALEKEMKEKGIRVLGWCTHYNKEITYYTGECHGFTPKRRGLEKNMLLTDFFKGEEWEMC